MDTVPFSKSYNRSLFSCKKHIALEEYIKKIAGQDVKRNVTAVHVLLNNNDIIGYYTLSNSFVITDLIPEKIKKKLPRYGGMPATLLGRLAVDDKHAGKGYGEFLIFDAFKKCLEVSLKIASWAIIVDPIDAAAVKFYRKYDFIEFHNSGRMFILIETIKKLNLLSN